MEENQTTQEVAPKAAVIVMKTGERVITYLKEVYDGEGESRRGICLLMIHPYSLELIDIGTEERPELQVKFSKWNPYAIDQQYRIPYDSVIAIGTPDKGLEDAYALKVQQVMQMENQNYQQQQQEIAEVISQKENTNQEEND